MLSVGPGARRFSPSQNIRVRSLPLPDRSSRPQGRTEVLSVSPAELMRRWKKIELLISQANR